MTENETLGKMSREELIRKRNEVARRLIEANKELAAVSRELRKRGIADHQGRDGTTQREYWGDGWLQKDPRRKTLADGSEKEYRYWVYHYIEDGQHKTEYIGSDKKLEEWKAAHSER